MKTFLAILTIVGLTVSGLQIENYVMSNYTFEKQYSQLWQLADKSSTIPAKQQYITQFVNALKGGKEKGAFSDYNAVWLQTPNNNFGANLKALETLSGRLIEIQNMDPTSFQYNTAIEQITKQEQGEAHQMMAVFQGCYNYVNYLPIWSWVGGLLTGFGTVALVVGGVGLFALSDFARRNFY